MRTAREAAAYFLNLDANRVGMCLWHVQDAFDAPHVYPNAITQWNKAAHKHPGDRTPRYGAPVYFKGGQHGHVAIYVGNGLVRSSDSGGSGRMATTSIGWFERNWGYQYLGWTEDIGGQKIDFRSYVDVYVAQLRHGVDDSESVRMLRLALIRRGYLSVKKPLSEKRPGNKYTKAVTEAVGKWQVRKGYARTGWLNNKQATRFFAPNRRVRLHLARQQN